MVRALLIAALLLAAPAARATCYADYKASRDKPLRLHYGTMKVAEDSCSVKGAEGEVARRLRDAGWNLLTVVSVFGPEGLEARARDAGEFHLRF